MFWKPSSKKKKKKKIVVVFISEIGLDQHPAVLGKKILLNEQQVNLCEVAAPLDLLDLLLVDLLEINKAFIYLSTTTEQRKRKEKQ